jgi:sRNA-binding protein
MIDKRLLQLAHYCRSIGYLRSLTTGAVSVDLDGAAAGTVTDEPAALAAARLATATRAKGPGHAIQQILHPQDDVTKLGACHA